MPAEFDRFAGSYDEVLARAIGTGGEVDRFAGYKADEVAQRLRGRRVGGVLDFGCGVGRGIPFLAGAFPDAELWAYDPSPESVEVARGRAPRVRATADWGEVPRGRFDCIVAANVFHHIPPAERVPALRRCGEALAAGGSLFVFEHNPRNPLTRRVFERCPFDVDARMIEREAMIADCRAAGLRVLRAPYTLFLPWRGPAVAMLHRALGWLPLGAQYYVQLVA
jgi:SAM-dependent methyltransferase